MRKGLIYSVSIFLMLISIGAKSQKTAIDSITVQQVLERLGEPRPKHFFITNEQTIKKGKDLVEKGQVELLNGKLSKPISKYFACTSCHNSIQEDPNITNPDPNERLKYLSSINKPFLQGSTFWGIVNREHWYNDDYYLKYGTQVKKANDDLRAAIQLCAVECAQGRSLDQWEEDAILAYFWSLELQFEDLNVPDSLKNMLENAILFKEAEPTIIQQFKSLYPLKSTATFGEIIADKKSGYNEEGDVLSGRQIFEHSCRHCHKEEGVSDFTLDYSRQTFKFLKKHMFKNNDYSIYQIIRKGTYASIGARPYMPHYPLEKMSNQQIESLRAYILSITD